MIILFGSPGAGKSLQGQILAVRHGWHWLSTGQLLRDSQDPEIMKQMGSGGLVDDRTAKRILGDSLSRVTDIDHVIVDGFPRELSQAKWLIENQPHHGRSISLVMMLEVPEDELIHRLELRERADDKPDSRKERLKIYSRNIKQIVDYFKAQKINVIHVSGIGTVGEVHDRLEAELKLWYLV